MTDRNHTDLRQGIIDTCKMYVHALAIGEPPRLSEVEMEQVHEQMKRMGYGQAPDLDDVGDVPCAVAESKGAAH